MAIARIGPTGYGGYGILWADFPYMETRGGYSGEFPTEAAAEVRALDIAEAHELPLTIEYIPTVNP